MQKPKASSINPAFFAVLLLSPTCALFTLSTHAHTHHKNRQQQEWQQHQHWQGQWQRHSKHQSRQQEPRQAQASKEGIQADALAPLASQPSPIPEQQEEL